MEKLAGSEAGLVTGMILTLDISIVEEAVEEPEVELGSCGILLKSSFESQVLSRLVSSALSRIEECRRLKEKSSGSDCGSSESDDSYSQEAREVDKQLWREARSCGSSDEGSSL